MRAKERPPKSKRRNPKYPRLLLRLVIRVEQWPKGFYGKMGPCPPDGVTIEAGAPTMEALAETMIAALRK